MTTTSIIGSGNMAAAIGTRAAKRGHTIELMSRDPAKAQALAEQIGSGTTVGTFGARPAGDIVILAVLYTGAVEVVTHYGDALIGKILIDITNPFNADVTGLVTTAGNSVTQQLAAAAPEDAHVVKAFNSILRGVLAEDKPMDAFFAGDSAAAKTRVAAFLGELGHAAPRRRRARDGPRPRVGRHPPGRPGTQRRRLCHRPGCRGPLKSSLQPGASRTSEPGGCRFRDSALWL